LFISGCGKITHKSTTDNATVDNGYTLITNSYDQLTNNFLDSMEYIYDASGRLLKDTYKDGLGNNSRVQIYTYTGDKLTRIDIWFKDIDVNGNLISENYYALYNYNANGYPSRYEEYSSSIIIMIRLAD